MVRRDHLAGVAYVFLKSRQHYGAVKVFLCLWGGGGGGRGRNPSDRS